MKFSSRLRHLFSSHNRELGKRVLNIKLSISNIGWESTQDELVYEWMRNSSFSGLEIAPTRVISERPYDKIAEIVAWKQCLEEKYGFVIPSMQSIWYGRQEKIFGTKEERMILFEYTKKAIDFASAIGCKNLVFGCPRNRVLPEGANPDSAICFFKELGDYAYQKGTTIGMEPNPLIYNTNYINDTNSAFELVQNVNSKGFLLNLDIGTMIYNKECIHKLEGNVKYINHVHISEPGLKVIEKRKLHKELYEVLNQEGYQGFVSIEMGKGANILLVRETMEYIKELFM